MPKKTKTPKTGAERQAAYRQRRADQASKKHGLRLDVFVEFHAKKRLERIARHFGCTISKLIEAWTETEEAKILKKLTPSAEKEYLDGL
jgi:hypothetical protein